MVLNCRYLLSNIHAKLTLLLHVRSAEDAAGAKARPRPGLDRTASLSGSSRAAARGEVRRTASLRRQQSATAAGKAPTEAKAKEKASTAAMDKDKTPEAKTSGASNTKDNTSAASASKAKTSAASAGKDKTPVPSSPKDPESVTFRSRTPRQPPAVPPKPRPANKVEDLKALAASATTSAPNTASPVAGAARRTVTKQSSTPQLQSKAGAGAGAGTQQTRAQKRSTGARKVEPSKEAAKEEGKTAKEAGRTVKEAVKPVMKKMAAKTSIAELARLADTQTREAGPGAGQPGQFVSHARATLSPAPARRQQQLRNIETVDTDTEDAEDTEPAAAAGEEESGIVSESVSASSVILMFGGTGRFKKSAAPQSPAPAPGRWWIVTNCGGMSN